MRCPSCGRENPHGSYFCEGCGNQIYFAKIGEVQPERATPLRRRPRNPAFYLLISLLGLGIVALGVIVYLHSTSSEPESTDSGFFGIFDGLDDFARDLLWAILAWGLIIFGSLLVIGGIVITVLAAAD